MKFLFDIFPVVVFFVVFKLYGIYPATAAAIGATVVQVGWSWWRHRKVDNMLWITLGIIVVFGGATLLLHDETFIKWKPTVLYWLFAAVLFGSELFFRRNLMKAMMGKQIALPDPVWRKVNASWMVFFGAMGALNLLVAYRFSTDIWVNFKLFGGMGLLLLFAFAQALFLSRHVQQEENR